MAKKPHQTNHSSGVGKGFGKKLPKRSEMSFQKPKFSSTILPMRLGKDLVEEVRGGGGF